MDQMQVLMFAVTPLVCTPGPDILYIADAR
jgi:threonine/homoserine/homoserine lactone efflux protein